MYGKLALTMRIITETLLPVAQARDDFLLPCVPERWTHDDTNRVRVIDDIMILT